mmetsp:Transcript_4254/g.27157  ORF Transcript_4254/g.27157 Transcript_4254/m.27157 type:complete len:209 (+) Transcript_4254:491-1117(+)
MPWTRKKTCWWWDAPGEKCPSSICENPTNHGRDENRPFEPKQEPSASPKMRKASSWRPWMGAWPSSSRIQTKGSKPKSTPSNATARTKGEKWSCIRCKPWPIIHDTTTLLLREEGMGASPYGRDSKGRNSFNPKGTQLRSLPSASMSTELSWQWELVAPGHSIKMMEWEKAFLFDKSMRRTSAREPENILGESPDDRWTTPRGALLWN